jgi:hypothetical protein
VYLTPLSISLLNDDLETTLWENPKPNSEVFTRPILLTQRKECRELVSEIFPPIQSDCDKLTDVQSLQIDNAKHNVKCNFEWSMVDGKLDTILKGDGGAFCQLCDMTREEVSDLQLFTEKGFETMLITKTSEMRKERWDKLESGEIGYDDVERHGQCHKPLTTADGNFKGILHQKLRGLDWMMKVINTKFEKLLQQKYIFTQSSK